ncbi:MAG TPA: trigger factor [Lachnospiraceae bacterium]|nr:trigger factor [Lachnospiraceae bacterium]
MNAQVISKENNIVKFSFQVGPEKLEEGMQHAYNKNKNHLSLPGFRKGKAPRKLIESQLGSEIFYDDAVNFILNTEYDIAVKELELDTVARPEIDAPAIDKAKGVTFEVAVAVKPSVKLGAYKGLEVEKADDTISEDAIEAELKKVQEKNSRMQTIEDRAAQMNDIVNIGYAGTVDGVAFEGGTADSFDLTLGSHSFIDTFEDQIVGHSIGDKFDVNVTFPAEYHAEELKGKEAVFAVDIKGISVKELPELNDEFAQDVSEFETLAEYKASIADKLKEGAEANAKQIQGDHLLDMAVANATMDVPEVMYENKIEQMMQDFASNISKQGLSVEVYCQYLGTTPEVLRENFRDSAAKSVRARLMLEQIAKEEGIVATEEELNEQICKIGEGYGLQPEKMLEIFSEEDRKAVAEDLVVQKALKVIEESAVIVEPKSAE